VSGDEPARRSSVLPFVIQVGGLAIGFEFDDPSWSTVLEPRYGPFRTDRAPELAVELVSRGPSRLELSEIEALRLESPTLERTGESLRLHSPSLDASVWPERGVARLTSPLDRHGVDVLLPLLLSLRLEDALILHATLAVEDGRAFACAGPSGAGKSTLAELLGERAVCDELALLRRGSKGWLAYSMPYWRGRPAVARLAGVRLLRHGRETRLAPLERVEATRRLSSQLIWPAHSSPSCELALELLDRLVAEVPVDELAFRPEPGVWPVLRGAEAA